MSVTRAAITTEDNSKVVQWARQASADENKAVTVAEILARLIENHEKANGNAVPKRIKGSSEQS